MFVPQTVVEGYPESRFGFHELAIPINLHEKSTIHTALHPFGLRSKLKNITPIFMVTNYDLHTTMKLEYIPNLSARLHLISQLF